MQTTQRLLNEYLYLFVYTFKELTCFYFLLEGRNLFVLLLAFHSRTLCDFPLMQQGMLLHKNIFKGHLILHRLKNIGTGFVSLILKTYCIIIDNTCELWRKKAIFWKCKDNLASSKTMLSLLSFIMCYNNMGIHLPFYSTNVKYAARKMLELQCSVFLNSSNQVLNPKRVCGSRNSRRFITAFTFV